MNELEVIEHLPRTILVVLDDLFKRGNGVNDFKFIGNKHGYSLTMHITSVDMSSPLLSPGTHKSPSACLHDIQRMHDWQARSSSHVCDDDLVEHRMVISKEDRGTPSRVDNGSDCSPIADQGDASRSAIELDHSSALPECTPAINIELDTKIENSCKSSTSCSLDSEAEHEHVDKDGVNINEDKCVTIPNSDILDIGTLEDDEKEHMDEKCQDLSYDTHESQACESVSTVSEEREEYELDASSTDQTDAEGNDISTGVQNNETFSPMAVDRKQYRLDIMDKKRNLTFKQIVHDTRNQQSKVYGLSDDVVISVDEKNKQYFSWGIIDTQAEFLDICELLNRWPAAKSKKCTYGVECLHKLLPDIVGSMRKIYANKNDMIHV